MRKMETDQFATLMAAVAVALPRDMDTTTTQGWISNPKALEEALRGALLPPQQPSLKTDLPTEITLGGRTYEILGFLQEGEERVNGYTMTARAKEMDAHLGQEDGEHILRHQEEIPSSLRDKDVVFVFTDWGHPHTDHIVYVNWNKNKGRWTEFWDLSSSYLWNSHYRVLRLKK